MGIFLIVLKYLLALLVICAAIKLFFRMLKGGVEWLHKITKKSKLASAIVGILIVGPRIALIIIIGNAIF